MRQILNTWAERHTFLIGFFEVLCPWKPRCNKSDSCPHCLKGEYHYYMAGRGLGFPVLLLILIGLAKLVKEVLL